MQTTLTSVTNPVWANAQQTAIDCLITTSQFGDEVLPFTASPSDVEPLGKEVFDACVNGEAGPIAPYVAPVATAAMNKNEATKRLAATDWVNQPDVYDPANTPHLTNRDAFVAYRAQIRDIAVNPIAGNLTWPVEPTAVWS
jgi:hypothetical protein